MLLLKEANNKKIEKEERFQIIKEKYFKARSNKFKEEEQQKIKI